MQKNWTIPGIIKLVVVELIILMVIATNNCSHQTLRDQNILKISHPQTDLMG